MCRLNTRLPDWVRGRGLAIYVTVFSGAMALGSAVWGELASIIGLSTTHFVAAACALLAIPLMRRWNLQASGGIDLAPSMHWPVPVVAGQIEDDAGPVLVTVEYDVLCRTIANRFLSLSIVYPLNAAATEPTLGASSKTRPAHGRFWRPFLVASWLEHLRQHERVTKADHAVEERVHSFLLGEPKVAHLVTPV